nr:Chain D, Cenp-H [Thermothielavioides terrestris NRRL 8126]
HEAEMKSNRRRWRIMKGAASAIVAGSGIDWVRDERLRDLVLDLPD